MSIGLDVFTRWKQPFLFSVELLCELPSDIHDQILNCLSEVPGIFRSDRLQVLTFLIIVIIKCQPFDRLFVFVSRLLNFSQKLFHQSIALLSFLMIVMLLQHQL